MFVIFNSFPKFEAPGRHKLPQLLYQDYQMQSTFLMKSAMEINSFNIYNLLIYL